MQLCVACLSAGMLPNTKPILHCSPYETCLTSKLLLLSRKASITLRAVLTWTQSDLSNIFSRFLPALAAQAMPFCQVLPGLWPPPARNLPSSWDPLGNAQQQKDCAVRYVDYAKPDTEGIRPRWLMVESTVNSALQDTLRLALKPCVLQDWLKITIAVKLVL